MSKIDEEILKTLQEIKFWIRLLAWDDLGKVLERVLDSEEKKIAYVLSDGKNTTSLVAKGAGTSQSSVSRWWQEWKTIGIADNIAVSGGSRAKSVFNLKELGIELSKDSNREEVDIDE